MLSEENNNNNNNNNYDMMNVRIRSISNWINYNWLQCPVWRVWQVRLVRLVRLVVVIRCGDHAFGAQSRSHLLHKAPRARALNPQRSTLTEIPRFYQSHIHLDFTLFSSHLIYIFIPIRFRQACSSQIVQTAPLIFSIRAKHL